MSEPRGSEARTSLFGSMGYLGSVNALALGAGLVRQKAFAVFLGPAAFGLFSLANSLFELLHTLTRVGAHTGLLREMSVDARGVDPGRALGSYRRVVRILVPASLAVAGLVTLFAEAIAAGPLQGELTVWSVRVVALAVPFFVWTALADSGLNAFDRIRRLALAKATTTLLSLAVMVLLVWRFQLTGAVLQIATGAAIGFAVAGLLFRRSVAGTAPSEPREGVVGRVFAIGVAQSVYHGVLTANLFLFRAVVVAELGAFENGLYQGVMGMSRQYVAALMSGVFVYLYPRLSAVAGDRGAFRIELSRALSAVLGVAVPISLLLLASRDWIVMVVFTQEFGAMVPLMAWSFSADVAVVAGYVLLVAALGTGRGWLYAGLGVVGELVHLGAFLWLLGPLGLGGAVAAYLVFGVAGLVLVAGALWRRGWLAPSFRLGLQIVAAAVLLGLVAVAPLDQLLTRAAALVLAAGWIWLWRRDIRGGVMP